jgi:succinate dehydrogenase / fumarate reductase cytochrome b subunit
MASDVQPKPVKRKPLEWFNLKGKRVGFWAYVVMRLSALGLVLYLFLHLVVLSQLAVGPAQWDAFVALVKSPAFLVLDVILIIGILAHGLNGIRLSLIGFGIGVPSHKLMLWLAVILTIVFSLLSALAIFTEIH